MCCRAWKIKEWRSTCQHVPLVQQGLLLMCRRMKKLQSSSCRLCDLLLRPRSWDFCPQVLSATSGCPRMQFALKFPNGHSLPSTMMACYLCAAAVGCEPGAELRSGSHASVHWEDQSGQESAQLRGKKPDFVTDLSTRQNPCSTCIFFPRALAGAVLQRWMAGPCAAALCSAQHGRDAAQVIDEQGCCCVCRVINCYILLSPSETGRKDPTTPKNIWRMALAGRWSLCVRAKSMLNLRNYWPRCS